MEIKKRQAIDFIRSKKNTFQLDQLVEVITFNTVCMMDLIKLLYMKN